MTTLWKLFKLKGLVHMKLFQHMPIWNDEFWGFLEHTFVPNLLYRIRLPRGSEQIFQFSSAASALETPEHAGSSVTSNDA